MDLSLLMEINENDISKFENDKFDEIELLSKEFHFYGGKIKIRDNFSYI